MSCFVGGKNGSVWRKRLRKGKENIVIAPRQFFNVSFCNSVGFSDNMGWFSNCWLLSPAIHTCRCVSRLSHWCMNHASFCGDKLPGFIAEKKPSFNPLTTENKIPQVSPFTEPQKDLPLHELFRSSGGNEVPITFTNTPQIVRGWAGIDQTAFIVKAGWVFLEMEFPVAITTGSAIQLWKGDCTFPCESRNHLCY